MYYMEENKVLKLKRNYTVHCGMAIGFENQKNKINNLKTEREKVENFSKVLL